MDKRIFIGALITGIVVLVKMYAEYYMGIHTERLDIAYYLVYVRYLIFIGVYLWIFRKVNYPDIKSFFIKSMLFFSLLSLIVGGNHFVYHKYINPQYEENYKNHLVDQIRQSKDMSEEHKQLKIIEIERYIQEYHWINTPSGAFIFYFAETFVIGILISLSGFFIFRKKVSAHVD